jgi:5-methylcytosine-specific restriction protein A
MKSGCPKLLTDASYCSEHNPKADRRRAYDLEHRNDPGRRLYKTKRWERYSKWHLRGHPWCVLCGARATVTDHIVPAHVAPELFFQEKNHRSLCNRCNVRAGIENRAARMKAPPNL